MTFSNLIKEYLKLDKNTRPNATIKVDTSKTDSNVICLGLKGQTMLWADKIKFEYEPEIDDFIVTTMLKDNYTGMFVINNIITMEDYKYEIN